MVRDQRRTPGTSGSNVCPMASRANRPAAVHGAIASASRLNPAWCRSWGAPVHHSVGAAQVLGLFLSQELIPAFGGVADRASPSSSRTAPPTREPPASGSNFTASYTARTNSLVRRARSSGVARPATSRTSSSTRQAAGAIESSMERPLRWLGLPFVERTYRHLTWGADPDVCGSQPGWRRRFEAVLDYSCLSFGPSQAPLMVLAVPRCAAPYCTHTTASRGRSSLPIPGSIGSKVP